MNENCDISEYLKAIALKNGAVDAIDIAIDDISFFPEFRDACKANYCGKYNKCWMCPPDVGDIDVLISKAKAYSHGVVYRTVNTLEDSFDIEGMLEAGAKHLKIAREITEFIIDKGDFLNLSCGGCGVCEKCTKLDNLPCRFPDRAIASIEGYGIGAYQLANTCNIPYIAGVNTVTYFGLVLYHRGDANV